MDRQGGIRSNRQSAGSRESTSYSLSFSLSSSSKYYSKTKSVFVGDKMVDEPWYLVCWSCWSCWSFVDVKLCCGKRELGHSELVIWHVGAEGPKKETRRTLDVYQLRADC